MSNQPNNSHNNKERMVFEEIHNWARNINNSVWLITSFFIALNFIAINMFFSDSDKCYLKSFLGCFCWQQWLLIGIIIYIRLLVGIIIFAILWLIPALVALIVIRISEKLADLLKEGNHPTKEKLHEVLKFEWADTKKEIKNGEFLKALKYLYGWIIAVFTIFFALVWILCFPFMG